MWRKKKTTEEFIEEARLVHGDKYDYSRVEYKSAHEKVNIICPIHGEFWQTAHNHLRGQECYKCGLEKRNKKNTKTTEKFIEDSRKIHGDKYDYSKVKYQGCEKKVCIICPIHGEFWQTPSVHLSGSGCNKCHLDNIKEKYTRKQEDVIRDFNKVHNFKYDYSKVDYKFCDDKVCIICPTHGEFWQTSSMHLMGSGCPKCKSSHLETDIRKFLEDNNIEFEEQKTFDWLKYRNKLFLDFYLPNHNIAIECQGGQHFIPTSFGSNKYTASEQLKLTQKRDNIKSKLCKENGIKLLYFSNLGIKYPYKVIENKKELLNEIRNYGKDKDTT